MADGRVRWEQWRTRCCCTAVEGCFWQERRHAGPLNLDVDMELGSPSRRGPLMQAVCISWPLTLLHIAPSVVAPSRTQSIISCVYQYLGAYEGVHWRHSIVAFIVCCELSCQIPGRR